MADLDAVLEAGTSAGNYGLSTTDVLDRLRAWDAEYGIEVRDAGDDRVTVVFRSLPDDLDALAREIADFCPDVIDQNFALLVDVLREGVDDDPELADLRRLAEGVDLDAPDAPFALLRNALRASPVVGLWWD